MPSARLLYGSPFRLARSVLRVIAFCFPLGMVGVTTGCSDGSTAPSGCCKICKEGKACGETGISKSDTCHVGQGCACNG